ncbi:DUF6585 family protein [Urbifossiella limnaea]|uniref:Uncharacterized protein n=1 Tax=Urbifossiella limnaea TaxID=2528023 RepID=A0A517XPE1_9BACT|nr:DUF6585 family protein [Urbifossiella limnaea]QDU19368.1 hypothetical protein ETAA1_12750 [Urbifossiella limnaea]
MTEPDDLTRAREELGDPEAIYQVNPAWFRTKLLVGLALVGVGVAAVGLAVVFGFKLLQHLFHFIIWPLLAGGGLVLNLYRQRGLHVLIYPTGLLRLRRGEVESFPWDEVAEVRLKTKRVDTAVLVRGPDGEPAECWLPAEVPDVQVWTAGLTVVRADGAKAEFSPALTGYAQLAEEVQRRTFPPLWRDAFRRFRDGRTLAFGKLDVNLLGIHHKGQLLPWHEVGKLTVAQGQVGISQKKKWLPWATIKPAAEVPNLHVLFALAAYAMDAPPAPESEPDEES